MSTIPNNLRADIFRQRIECKNTLTQKGGMYVGTGQSYGSGAATIYSTEQLVPGEQHSVFGSLPGTTYGVGYITGGLTSKFFNNNAITKNKNEVIANGCIGDSKIGGKIASTKITGISFVVDNGTLTITYD